MKKPKEAIERMRGRMIDYAEGRTVLAYLDSLPDDATTTILRALAKIAPKAPKKRMVNLWLCGQFPEPYVKPADWQPDRHHEGWHKVAGPVEIDE